MMKMMRMVMTMMVIIVMIMMSDVNEKRRLTNGDDCKCCRVMMMNGDCESGDAK